MVQAECVPEFVHDLLLESSEVKILIRLHTVERICQTNRRDDGCNSVQLSFAEDECEDGNEKVDPYNGNPLLVRLAIRIQELNEQRGGIVLASGSVESPVKVERGRSHVRSKTKNLADNLRELRQPCILKLRGIQDVYGGSHAGVLSCARFLQSVLFDFVVERNPVDLKDFRRPGDVPTVLLQD